MQDSLLYINNYLKKKYGIQVNTMSILPIHVEYSDTTRYEVSQEAKHEKYNGSQNNYIQQKYEVRWFQT